MTELLSVKMGEALLGTDTHRCSDGSDDRSKMSCQLCCNQNSSTACLGSCRHAIVRPDTRLADSPGNTWPDLLERLVHRSDVSICMRCIDTQGQARLDRYRVCGRYLHRPDGLGSDLATGLARASAHYRTTQNAKLRSLRPSSRRETFRWHVAARTPM